MKTARGATVTLYGEGLYAADTWLIGAGNRGQDLAMLIFELPVLLLVLRWYRRGSPVAPVVLAGVLAFFTYYYVSQVFGIAQNRLFPLYVAAASLAGFSLVLVASRLTAYEVAAAAAATARTSDIGGLSHRRRGRADTRLATRNDHDRRDGKHR